MEQYEYITIDIPNNGQYNSPVLYSCCRIKEDLTSYHIPLYTYDIRHGDDGLFTTLEERVIVDYAGTIITTAPIDLGPDGHIPFYDGNVTSCFGKLMTVKEFVDGRKENEHEKH